MDIILQNLYNPSMIKSLINETLVKYKKVIHCNMKNRDKIRHDVCCPIDQLHIQVYIT